MKPNKIYFLLSFLVSFLYIINCSAQTLAFKNGFQGTTTMSYTNAQHPDISGNDGVAKSDWVNDLEKNNPYFTQFSFNYEQGDDSQRKVSIVADPANPNGGNKVLSYKIMKTNVITPKGEIKGRIQCELNNRNSKPAGGFVKETYQKVRMFLSPDFDALIDSYAPEQYGWLTIMEFRNNPSWDADPNHQFRISVGMNKKNLRTKGSPLLFTVNGETLDGDHWRFPSNWDIPTSFEIPLGKWITLEYYIKEGDNNTGRFYLAATVEGVKTVVADKHVITKHDAAGYIGDGFNDWSPMKAYCSKGVMDAFVAKQKSLEIYWDDLELWFNRTPETVIVTNVPVTGVSVNPTSTSVAVNATTQLTATVAPATATNKNVTWSSSNTAVATVSGTGLVTGKGAGTATITVTTVDGAKKATTAVTVNKVNQTITFAALPTKTVGNADFNPGATASSGLAVTYTSSNTSVATIVSNQIHIVDAGIAVITASQTGDAVYNAAANVTQTLSVSSALRTPENPLNLINGLTYGYYEGVYSALPDFSIAPIKTGVASTTDLTPRLREDNFAFSFKGFINIPADGTYTFYTSSDDGSALYIGNTLVVNNDGLHGLTEVSGTIGLRQGRHAITINYFDNTYSNTLTVSYAGPGIAKTLVPESAYYTTAPSITLEAEDATLFQAVAAPSGQNGSTGNTGTGYVDYINASADYIEWTVNAPGDGTYNLNFRYSLFSGTRNLQISVNTVTVNSSLVFPSNGNWSIWQTATVTATLNTGVNKVRATATGTSGPNMDNLTIEKSGIGRIEVAENFEVDQDKIVAYPNPVNDILTVSFNSNNESDALLELVTLTSNVVAKKTHKTVKGENIITLDVRGVESGLYLLKVSNGLLKAVKKIIIAK